MKDQTSTGHRGFGRLGKVQSGASKILDSQTKKLSAEESLEPRHRPVVDGAVLLEEESLVNLLVQDRPDFPHVADRPRLDPLSDPQSSLHLLLLSSSSSSSTTTIPTCTVVLGRQRSLSQSWVNLGEKLVVVALYLLLLVLWVLMMWKMLLLLGIAL